MAKLTKEQEQNVAQWAAQGANLNEIQDRLKRELGITLTYFEARLLVIELGLKLQEKKKDPEPVATDEVASHTNIADDMANNQPDGTGVDDGFQQPQADGGKVQISVDQVTTPGAAVSGRVTFSDGQTAIWYLDQFGRLGLKGTEPGYKPPAADVPVFQQQLQVALQQAGF